MWINTEGNIIRNYDFSNDLSFWDLDNCGGLVSKNPDYYSGIKPISRKNYCVVLNRNSYWQGLRQDITARVSPGATYTVSTYVRVWGPVRGLSSVQAQLTIWVTGGRKFVLIRRVNASKDKWEILEGTFSLQTIPGRIYIDFEGPPPGVDLLISPVVVYSTDLDEHESGDKINLPISVGDNIILNHDFMGGLQFWNLYACNGFVVTEANYFEGVQPYSGKNYCVTLDRTHDWQGLEQEITNRVSPGFIYDFSAFVRVWGPVQEAAKVQATVRLEYPDLETKYIIIESVIATKENWEKLEGTFSFMTMPKLATIYFEGPDPGIILLIDSVVVTCVSHEQENENVINLPISIGGSSIENHDFSDGLHYWELDNCGGYVPKSPDYYKGVQPIAGKNYCVVLNRNSYWQGLRRDITESVSAGTTYTVSTNVRVWGPVRGLSSVQAQLTIWAPEGRKFVLIRRVNASMDEWEKLEGTFLLESIPGRVYIDFEGPPPGVNLLISPVMVYSSGLNEQEKKIRNRIDSPISSGGNIILNHDFHEGLSFWNLHACNGFVATESNYYEGVQPYSGKNYCVTLDRTEDWQGLEQDITDSVSPRSTYIISAFLRVWGADQESCQINAALRLEYPNFETAKKIIGRVTVKADSWVMLDGTFLLETMPRQVIFYFDGPAPGVVLLIDSVVIEEHKDSVEVGSSMDKIHEDNVGNEAYTNHISHH
ncbi:PREDICTED: uncharacterized protein LOC104596787 isoform X3 [Nelumbo nucifera]|nr:PREDICTED: uncharacterized protein LOC104596787 isoform X3 [Nelumbo nucifera]XP_010256378.1 PREDICTED: uncharacterized protein LOC104596787 isoform X3 [Nelumbo nucifera]XP_010256379.1 PREDICTED: uncharacterized protein LOC104596787 isoform X3 [Nelumbo nucifera]